MVTAFYNSLPSSPTWQTFQHLTSLQRWLQIRQTQQVHQHQCLCFVRLYRAPVAVLDLVFPGLDWQFHRPLMRAHWSMDLKPKGLSALHLHNFVSQRQWEQIQHRMKGKHAMADSHLCSSMVSQLVARVTPAPTHGQEASETDTPLDRHQPHHHIPT